MICICCRIPAPAGQNHPHLIYIQYGAMKGTHRLCEACYREVETARRKLVEGRHTFEVLKNAVINVQERIARRQQLKRFEVVRQPCRLDKFNLL
jgi:hypothetical protein